MTAMLEERRHGIYARLVSCASNLARQADAVALLGISRHILALRPEPAVAAEIAALERACAIRPAPGAAAVFVFGDSHAPAMFGNWATIHDIHYGACTMHAVGRDGLDLLRLEHFGIEDGDEVVFQFGEIDVRIHIARQRDRHGRAPEEVIAALADAYIAAIDAKVASYRTLGVTLAGVVPPSNDPRLLAMPALQPVGSIEERVGFTELLNQHLFEAAEPRGYRFLDLNHLYRGPDGVLPSAATLDGLHVGSAARFLAIRALGALIRRPL
jgi:hypothetical protein